MTCIYCTVGVSIHVHTYVNNWLQTYHSHKNNTCIGTSKRRAGWSRKGERERDRGGVKGEIEGGRGI